MKKIFKFLIFSPTMIFALCLEFASLIIIANLLNCIAISIFLFIILGIPSIGIWIEHVKDNACPNCYGKMHLTEKSFCILSGGGHRVYKCNDCGREVERAVYYLD